MGQAVRGRREGLVRGWRGTRVGFGATADLGLTPLLPAL